MQSYRLIRKFVLRAKTPFPIISNHAHFEFSLKSYVICSTIICPSHHLSYRADKTAFVLHIICPTGRRKLHLSYTSFVLQEGENFICPSHHLSYRAEKTSFVLHIICPTERKYHNWSYTSFFLYFNCTLHINCPYRERLTSFVLQLDCTLDYLSYRDGIQWFVLQRWDTMICPTEMGYNDLSYRDGIQ